jgi:diguanylate cyclase (GGDEF)-like protein/PAS domain S-box-containing protein
MEPANIAPDFVTVSSAEPAGGGAHLDGIDTGLIVYETSGEVAWANPAAERLLGVRTDQLAGLMPRQPLFAVREDGAEWPPDEYPAVITARTGRPTSRVVVGVHRPDGSFAWLSMSTRAQLGDDGAPVSVLVRFNDITERQRAQVSMAEREQFFRLLAEHSRDIISRHSTDGWLAYVSPSIEHVLGYAAEDVTGPRPRVSVWFPEERSKLAGAIRRTVTTTEEVNVVWRAQHADGHTVWLESRGHAVRHPMTGEPTEIISVSRDVTERLQAQEALRQSETLYRTLAESIPGSLVLVVDNEFRVQVAAGAGLAVLGVRPESLVGNSIATLPLMEGLDRIEEYLEAALNGKTRAVELTTATGRRLWTQIAPLGGSPAIGALVMATDITDRLRIEDALREAEQRFTDGFDASPIGMALQGPDGKLVRVNDAYCRMVGRSRGHLMGSTWRELTHPDDIASTQDQYDKLLSGALSSFTLEKRYLKPDGEVVEAQLSTSLVLDRAGQPVQMFVQAIDLTERHRAERGMAEAELMFRRMFEDSPIGMALVDLQGAFALVNPALCVILGCTMDEVANRLLTDFVHPDDSPLSSQKYDDLVQGRASKVLVDYRFVRPDGGHAWVQVHGIMLHRPGRDPQILFQMHDITERRRLEEQLRYLADHDPLTGLLNRRGFDLALRVHENHCRRYGARGALVLIDLDNFKLINDQLGHSVGDEVLVAVAQCLRQRLRAGDLIGRLGGDEFAVLLPEGSTEQVQAVAAAIVDAVASDACAFDPSTNVSASVGAALFIPESLEASAVSKRADDALYRAKEAGRARWILADR